MKIAIDARRLYAPSLKGIGVYIQNLLPALADLDPQSEFILFYDPRQEFTSRLPALPGFRDRGISVAKGDTFYAWEQLRLPFELWRTGADLFHAPANTLPLRASHPCVVTVHDTKSLEIPTGDRKADFYENRVQRWALRRADRIICDSLFTKQRLLECVPIEESRAHVVYLGINDVFRVIEDRQRLQRTLEQYGIHQDFILFAGGESAPKNISRLLQAFSLLKRSTGSSAALVIPGIRTQAILAKHQQEAKQQGISDSVIFAGYVPEADLIDLYNSAQFLVYPSLWEGFGFPPLEAMACGLPVAAANATSIPEVVGEAALLFDGTNTDDMAAKMRMLLSTPALREQLRASGLKHVRNFTWRRTASQTLEIYSSCARSARPSPEPLLDRQPRTGRTSL